uniref:Uncharacterized protein n=1 Tax=Arundo donax TaxID=35708 RepID=A0A0A8XU39_ARUDO
MITIYIISSLINGCIWIQKITCLDTPYQTGPLQLTT